MSNSQFTFPKLHEQMSNNNGECLLMYDELTLLYQQLEHQSGTDKTVLLTLNSGNEWNRSTLTGGDCVLEKTHFNYTGFMQPAIAIAMLSQGDVEGFNDRHLAVICPKRQRAWFDQLGSSNNDISLSTVLKVIRNCHTEPKEYTLSEERRVLFKALFEEMEGRLDEEDTQDDPELSGIFSKAQGQLARLSMVLHALYYTTVQIVTDGDDYQIPDIIGSDIMSMAIELIRYCISQKLALMPVGQRLSSEGTEPTTEVDTSFYTEFAGSIRKYVLLGDRQFTASKLSQSKLMPRNKIPEFVGGPVKAFPVSKVKDFMETMVKVGASRKHNNGRTI